MFLLSAPFPFVFHSVLTMSFISDLSFGLCFRETSKIGNVDLSRCARIHMIRVIAVNIIELDLVDGDIKRIHEVTDSSPAEILGPEVTKVTLVEVLEGVLVKYNGDDVGLLAAYQNSIRPRISDDQVVKGLMQIITYELQAGPSRMVTLDDPDSYPLVDIFREAEIDRIPRRNLEHGMFGTDQDIINCSICMECVELGTVILQLACGHWYHPLCATDWLRIANSCPSCRCEILFLPHISFF